jgi:hypothetical protein
MAQEDSESSKRLQEEGAQAELAYSTGVRA